MNIQISSERTTRTNKEKSETMAVTSSVAQVTIFFLIFVLYNNRKHKFRVAEFSLWQALKNLLSTKEKTKTMTPYKV